MKPWLLTLLLSPAALAGGAEPRALPRLTLEAQTIGRTAELQRVPAVVYPDDGPYFQMFPAHTRAVLNPPGQRWKAQHDADLPPAYVAVYPVSGWLGLFRSPANAQLAREQIETLRALNGGGLSLTEVRPLPFLPLRNAFQAGVGAVRRVDTPVLRGMRYLI